MACHLADILLHLGESRFPDAESWLQTAILSHEQLGMKWDLAGDYIVFARLLKLQHREAEAKDCLDKSFLLFHECGAEGWCLRIEQCAQTGNQKPSPLSIPQR